MVTIGFGRFSPASRMRIPRPPQNRTTFICVLYENAIRSDRSDRCPPTQRRVQTPVLQVSLNPLQTHVFPEHLSRQTKLCGARVQLLDPSPDRPLRLERRKVRTELLAADPIAAGIRAAPLQVPHAGPRHD